MICTVVVVVNVLGLRPRSSLTARREISRLLDCPVGRAGVRSGAAPEKFCQTSVRGCWLACLHASSPRELMNMPARSDFGPYCVVRGAPAQVCACMQHPKTTYAFTCWDCQGFSHRSHTRCALVCCTQVDEYARCAPYWQHLSALRLDWTAWAFHTVNSYGIPLV